MSGKSPVSASEEQRSALAALAGSRDRGEADRARAIGAIHKAVDDLNRERMAVPLAKPRVSA
jgi:hypothetical protein